MRLPSSSSIYPAAFVLLLLPTALAAQAPATSRPGGCRGTTSQTSSITLQGTSGESVVIPSYPMIETVQPGSPAQRAGMRYGDLVVLQDGHDLVGNPPTRSLFAGDTVRLVVRRDDREVPLTVVLGRWDPPEETPDAERVCRPLETGSGGG
jgi:hypothetical protein